jgi:hypothetical protein
LLGKSGRKSGGKNQYKEGTKGGVHQRIFDAR